VGYQVLRYDTLQTWPQDMPTTPSPDLLRLTYYRAAYDTILNTINPLIQDSQAAEFTHVFGRNQKDGAGDRSTLSELQVEVQGDIDRLKTVYDSCKKLSDCDTKLETHNVEDPYVYMTRLPLEMVNKDNPIETVLPKDDLAQAIFDQYLLPARDNYCQSEWAGKHPGCMSENDLTQRYFGRITDNLTETDSPAPGAYQFKSLSFKKEQCLTGRRTKDQDMPFYSGACNQDAIAAKQRLRWEEDGRIEIRSNQCLYGPSDENGNVRQHDCFESQGQPFWRFIPLKRDAFSGTPETPGLIQEAGYGRCLVIRGQDKTVRAKACDHTDKKQQWILLPK